VQDILWLRIVSLLVTAVPAPVLQDVVGVLQPSNVSMEPKMAPQTELIASVQRGSSEHKHVQNVIP